MYTGIIDVLQTLNNLNSIKRLGHVLYAGVNAEEAASISEKGYRIACIMILLENKVKDINFANVLKYAIMREWSIAVVGEFPLSSKSYYSYFQDGSKDMFRQAEGNALSALTRDAKISVPQLSDREVAFYRLCDNLARILELIDLKQKGNKHGWIDKMYLVWIQWFKETDTSEFDFLPDVLSELDVIFRRGYMENKYLTRATKDIWDIKNAS